MLVGTLKIKDFLSFIDSKKYYRRLPVNFDQEDKSLFEYELSKELPEVTVRKFMDVLVLPEQIITKKGKRIGVVKTRAKKLNFKQKLLFKV